MIVEAQVTIEASRAAVWSVITDLEGAADLLSGVEQVEIVARPASGVVGLRWRETRILFDKPETVEKWITDAVEGTSYTTRAEIPGFVFLATFRIEEEGGGLALVSSHETRPTSLAAKLKAMPMALFFRGMIEKAILQDLNDLKAAVERS